MSVTIHTGSRDESIALGHGLGQRLTRGDVVLLHGNLGSGKTTVAQGLLAGLGVTGPIPSPTFTLINEYEGQTAAGNSVTVYHLDLYRLHDEADLDSIGLDEYLAPVGGISLIEWPERAGAHLDGVYLVIELASTSENQRQIRLSALPEGAPRFAWLESLF